MLASDRYDPHAMTLGLLSADDMARALDGTFQDAGKAAGEGAKIAVWAVAQRAGGTA